MIKKGSKVKILAGKDKKKEGEIIEIDRSQNRAKVKGMNIIKKHIIQFYFGRDILKSIAQIKRGKLWDDQDAPYIAEHSQFLSKQIWKRSAKYRLNNEINKLPSSKKLKDKTYYCKNGKINKVCISRNFILNEPKFGKLWNASPIEKRYFNDGEKGVPFPSTSIKYKKIIKFNIKEKVAKTLFELGKVENNNI